VCDDATKIDYRELCVEHNMGDTIDYLSLDLEPPDVTFNALLKILESGLKFRVITFETDFYRYRDTLEPSRKILNEHGYELVVPGIQDDFYVSKEYIQSL